MVLLIVVIGTLKTASNRTADYVGVSLKVFYSQRFGKRMITFNVFVRIFQIRTKSATATAFAVDEGQKQYLVTALHVLPNPEKIKNIDLLFKNGWKTIPVKFTGKGNDDIDVVVVSPRERIAPAFDMPLSKGEMTIGQDVFFLGFPYGMTSEINDPGWHLPYPLVKKACLSGSLDRNGKRIWLLDGINNPGFSGGPVVFQPIGNRTKHLMVMGVVSGYRFNRELVHIHEKATESFIKVNTGIIYASSAADVIDIIRSNTNGLEIEAQ